MSQRYVQLLFNIGSLYCQSIASSNGPLRRRHIFLEKHIRFPTIQHPRGRTSHWIHKPKGPLNPLGTSLCLLLWDQRKPWSRGSTSRKPFCNWFARQLVLQPAWVWLRESHLKTAFQILKSDVKKKGVGWKDMNELESINLTCWVAGLWAMDFGWNKHIN